MAVSLRDFFLAPPSRDDLSRDGGVRRTRREPDQTLSANVAPGGTDTTSDAELVQRLRDATETEASTAFSTLFLRHTPAVFAAIIHRMCDDDTARAEDAVQAVMIRVWERRAVLPPIEDIRAYLIRAAARECLDVRRTTSRSLVRDATATQSAMDSAAADAAVMDEELRATLADAIAALPGRMGELFRAWYSSGATYETVAAQFGVTAKAVDQARLRAIAHLRRSPTLAPFLKHERL